MKHTILILQVCILYLFVVGLLFAFLLTSSGGTTSLLQTSSTDGITDLVGLTTGGTESEVSRLGLLLSSDGARLFTRDNNLVWDRGGLLLNRGELLSGRVSLLGLARLQGEKNKFGLVELKALHIGLESFGRSVGAAVVHSNTDGLSILGGQTSSLQFGLGESTTETNAGVVAQRLRVNDRSEGTSYRLGVDGGGFGSASFTTADLAGRLVEPGHNLGTNSLLV